MKMSWKDFVGEKRAQDFSAFGGMCPPAEAAYRSTPYYHSVNTPTEKALENQRKIEGFKRKAKAVPLRIVGEAIPFAHKIPAVGRQMEEDFQARFAEWFERQPPERQKRIYDTFLSDKGAIYDPYAMQFAFRDMPGSEFDQMKNMALMSATMGGRIKAYRPVLQGVANARGLPNAQLGHLARRLRQIDKPAIKGSKWNPHFTEENLGFLLKEIEKDVARTAEAAKNVKVNGPMSMGDAFSDNWLVRNIETLREVAPDVYRSLMSELSQAVPYKHYNSSTMGYGAAPKISGTWDRHTFKFKPGYQADLTDWAIRANNRLENSPQMQKWLYDPEKLIPVELDESVWNGRFSPESELALRRYLYQSIEDGSIPHPGLWARRYARNAKLYPATGGPLSSGVEMSWAPWTNPSFRLGLVEKGGKNFVHKDIFRHEFGHVSDLQGNPFRLDHWIPERWLNPMPGELRANRRGGVEFNPGTDSYLMRRGNPIDGIKAIWKKYADPPLPLPK